MDDRTIRAPQIDLFTHKGEPDLRTWMAQLPPPSSALDLCGGTPGATRLYRLPLFALDFETTGLDAHRGDAVCEIGLVAATGDHVEVLLSSFVDPGRPLSADTRRITGIDDRDLVGAPLLSDLISQALKLIGAGPLVMHNAPFDLHFLFREALAASLNPPECLCIDTLLMARFLGRSRISNSLRETAECYGVSGGVRAHRAADDALTTALVYHALVPYLEQRGVRTVGDLVRGRMAGAARVLVARPSSVLLDLASRAAAEGAVVTLVYAGRPGGIPVERRVRARAVEGERYLIGWDMAADGERTYRLDRILSLNSGETMYKSPWLLS
jgi:DNA polymerase III epsilon subunit-like protein